MIKLKVKKGAFLLLVLSCLTGRSQYEDPRVNGNDSILFSLNYFLHSGVGDNVKKTIREASELYGKPGAEDVLINKLLFVEEQLADMLFENSLLNIRPIDRSPVFMLANMLVDMTKKIPPQGEHRYFASALHNLGVFYFAYNNVADGYPLILNAYKLRKQKYASIYDDYLKSVNKLAEFYEGHGMHDLSLPLLREALAIEQCQVTINLKEYANTLLALGTVYRNQQKFDSAAIFFYRQLAAQKELFGEETIHYAIHLNFTGDLFGYLFRYKEALALYSKALEISKKLSGEESLLYAVCLNSIACTYYSTAEYNKALPYYKQSLAIKEKLFGNDYVDNALNLHNMATTYQRMGRYSEALPMYQRAVEISEKALSEGTEFVFNHAFNINFLASIYQTLGQYSAALDLLKRATELTRNVVGDQHPYYAKCIDNLAILYRNMGMHDSALFYFQKVRAIREKNLAYLPLELAATTDHLSNLYMDLHLYDTALSLCREAMEIRKKLLTPDHPEYASSLKSMGDKYLASGVYDSARYYLQASLNILSKVVGKEHPDYAKTLTSLALADFAEDHKREAAALLGVANNTVLKYLQTTYGALSEQERIKLVAEEYFQFSYLPSILYTGDSFENADIISQVYTNELALKGTILQSQEQVLSSIRRNGKDEVLQLYKKWRTHRSIIGRELLLPIHERTPGLDSIQDLANSEEQQLSRFSAAFHSQRQSQVITADDIIQNLKTGEAAVEFIRFRLFNRKWTDSTIYAALVALPTDSSLHFIPLFEERQLLKLIAPSASGDIWAIRQLYSGSMEPADGPGKLTDPLFALVWKPLEKYLKNAHTVYYAPTALLNRISFNALRLNANSRLIDKYQLKQVLNTRSLVMRDNSDTKPSSISIWGDIQYNNAATTNLKKYGAGAAATSSGSSQASRGNEWVPLPGTREEIYSIKNVCSSSGDISISILTDTSATEEKFQELDANGPEVIHIATHGFFRPFENIDAQHQKEISGTAFSIQPNPMFRSGLILAGGNSSWKKGNSLPGKADGILIAYEIAHMDLSKTKLVVLSACNTALGDLEGNEGVFGLQRAFKMAGVKQLLITLWKVPDKQTRELMSLFYKNWLSGHSISQAFTAAQLAIKKKYPEPYYWAGFVLVE